VSQDATDWGPEERGERRGVPAWVWWGCGGGCLLALLALVGLLALGGSLLKRAFDPEQAWSGVAELLPHDERPADWEAVGASQFGVGFYFLRPPDQNALLIVQRARDQAEIELLLEPGSPADAGWEWILEGARDHPVGTLELQGRAARCLRFASTFDDFESQVAVPAHVVRLDVSGSGPPTLLHVVLGAGAGADGDDGVRALLAPFDVWRGR
jgi:hypothetical protein